MTVAFLPDQASDKADALKLDFLIVGAGPAGASLACFLGKYGSHISLFSCSNVVVEQNDNRIFVVWQVSMV